MKSILTCRVKLLCLAVVGGSLLQASCSSHNKISRKGSFRIDLSVSKLAGGQLPSESKPAENVKVVSAVPVDADRAKYLEQLVRKFNANQDELLVKIFSKFYPGPKGPFQIILTSGVPEPYDAWVANYQGQFAIFMNLDSWSKERLAKSGLAVVRHEVTHVLLKPLLKPPPEGDELAQLRFIVINEGLAHFLGYSGDRDRLLFDKVDKGQRAELGLRQAERILADPKVDRKTKIKILRQADTGDYWDKYASIAGMFRAASIYQQFGVQGLVRAIENSSFDSVQFYPGEP